MLLLSDYLRRPVARTSEFDLMIYAAFRRPTLGQLIELSTRLLRTYRNRPSELFVPELYALYYRPDGGRTASTRSFLALTSYRNRLKHGAEGVWREDVYRSDFEGAAAGAGRGGESGPVVKHHLASVLDAVAFLEHYPLIYLTSMTYEHGAFLYGYERYTGAYSDFDRGAFAYKQPLENKQLYLLSRRDERVLRLDPLIRRERCATCGVPTVFVLFNFSPGRDRGGPDDSEDESTGRRREKLEYLSYTCGHTLVDTLTPERAERGEGLTRILLQHHGEAE
jgi:hypothetical protein